MTNEQILYHLKQSGVKAELAGDYFLVSDANCFTASVFYFLGEFQILLYIIAGFLLAGWAISLIRGAKMNIVNNMRNLFLMFAVLSIIKPVMNAVYGSDLEKIECRKIKASAEDVRRIINSSNARLPDGFKLPDGFMESMIAAGQVAEPEEPEIAPTKTASPAPASIRTDGRRRRLNQIVLRQGQQPRRVVQIEDHPVLRGSMHIAQGVLRTFGIRIRDDNTGGGYIGDSRSGGRRQHAGTDWFIGGNTQHAVGTAVPTLFGGRIVSKPNDLVRANDQSLNKVVIQHDDGTRSTMLYVKLRSDLRPGDRVNAGDIIGSAQDLRPFYGAAMTQHVHYELRDRQNNIIDAEGLY